MPAKRRAPVTTAKAGGQEKKARAPSKLARENDISAEQEAEIKEAFQLFAAATGSEYFPEEREVLSTSDVRRAMIAIGLRPSHGAEMREILSTVDPTSIGEVPYESFVAVCALKMHARASSSGRQAEQARIEEVRAAYRLFTGGSEGPITMAHLRRVAAELKEDEVTDDQLKDMVAEANGGVGAARGVRFDDFEAVMRRAGVFT